MIEGPLGAAAFNNEFGRPCIAGYFRTFEQPECRRRRARGYHKPIMIAGGLGNVRRTHVEKGEVPVGAHLVVLGGPAMLIGLGGGAASSVGSGKSSRGSGLRLGAARQSGDPAARAGSDRPLLGAGARQSDPPDPRRGRRRPVQCRCPRPSRTAQRGARIELRAVPNAEPGMSPHGDLVQRGAGALRAGGVRAGSGDVRGHRAARALSVRGGRPAHRGWRAARARQRSSATARSTCPSTCCWASRRACSAMCATCRRRQVAVDCERASISQRLRCACCRIRRWPTRPS